MTQTFEDAGKFGKEFMDTGLKSLASLSKGWQSIALATDARWLLAGAKLARAAFD